MFKCWLNCQLASFEALLSLLSHEKTSNDPTPSWSAVLFFLRLVVQKKRHPSTFDHFSVFSNHVGQMCLLKEFWCSMDRAFFLGTKEGRDALPYRFLTQACVCVSGSAVLRCKGCATVESLVWERAACVYTFPPSCMFLVKMYVPPCWTLDTARKTSHHTRSWNCGWQEGSLDVVPACVPEATFCSRPRLFAHLTDSRRKKCSEWCMFDMHDSPGIRRDSTTRHYRS